MEKIIDLSSFDSEEDTVAGIAPEYITRDRVRFHEIAQVVHKINQTIIIKN